MAETQPRFRLTWHDSDPYTDMNITDLLIRERILCCADIGSKKRLFERLGELLAGTSGVLSQNDIFDALINREKLGSTGIGHGVAIPHGRIQGLTKPIAAFVQQRQAQASQ